MKKISGTRLFGNQFQFDIPFDKNNINNLINICLKHYRPVREPLVLISQIQRSGGSLLSQLFDGHLEVHAHPHELKMGYPKKYYWPKIYLSDSPERWFFLLFEDIVLEHIHTGFKKSEKKESSDKSLPFVFSANLQNKIFMNYINSIKNLSLRDVFDGYMTSYFNAWLNNSNLHGNSKKCITAFTPRMSMFENNVENFFTVYPDGKLISIIRDPKNWYPSASRHRERSYGQISAAMNQWKNNLFATIRNKEQYTHRVCIIRFEDLIAKTESVMRYLSSFLDIEFSDILLTPTFNKSLISANTSFEIEKQKIIDNTLYRYKTLNAEDLNTIESLTHDEYESSLRYFTKF